MCKTLVAVAVALSAAAVIACSSAPLACEPSTCKPSNTCMTGFDTYADERAGSLSIACRLPCSSPDDCPRSYHCARGNGAAASCTPDRHAYVPGPGQWGAPCNPGDLGQLGACDTAQGFACASDGPDDPSAFCTQLDCADDGDCTGGFWCATINDAEDQGNGSRSSTMAGTSFMVGGALVAHTQRTLCLPRAWDLRPLTRCAPCTSDIDCPHDEGVAQHCKTQGAFCARECSADAECNFDAFCDGDGLCTPRAGACTITGRFGDPCRSDLDCNSGICARAAYSNELFCTERVTSTAGCTNPVVACNVRTGGPDGFAYCVDLSKQNLGVQCVPVQNVGSNAVYDGHWSRLR